MPEDVAAWMLDNGTTVAIATKDIEGWEQVGTSDSLVDLITSQGRFRVQFPVNKIRQKLEDLGWKPTGRPVPLFTNPKETEEMKRLREVVAGGLGDSEFELTGVRAGENGELLGVFRKKHL